MGLLLDSVWKRTNRERLMILGVVEKKEQSERTELRVAATQEQEAARWP